MKFIYLIILLAITGPVAFAQDHMEASPKKIYYAPNGKKIPGENIDSVAKAIGGRFRLNKEAYGNDSVVVHVIKMSAVEVKTADSTNEAREFKSKAMLNSAALNFTLKDLDGKLFTLSDFKGEIVVLNFWFTTCPPCIAEMDALNTLAGKYKTDKVKFVAITFNDEAMVRDFLKRRKFAYRHLIDGKKVCDEYNVVGYPTHIVIDQKGFIRFSQLGGKKIEEAIKKNIDKALMPNRNM